jgi:hypothetical protein
MREFIRGRKGDILIAFSRAVHRSFLSGNHAMVLIKMKTFDMSLLSLAIAILITWLRMKVDSDVLTII